MARADPLITVADGLHALTGAVNSLIVEGPDDTAVLIDTGQDADAGKRIRRALDELGRTPTVILNTHSHADHFGGNAYLVRRYPEVEVLAPEIEASVIRAPFLEPVYLFHGANPPAELRSKWLMAPASPVHREVGAGEQVIGGVDLDLLDVRGHAHRQLAVRIGDFLFAADAVFGERTLERYPLPFAQDVGAQLSSYQVVSEAAGAGVQRLLPGHGELTRDVEQLTALNRAAVEHAVEVVLSVVSANQDGASTEEVLVGVAAELDLDMNDLARYHLNLCTVSAYLSYLKGEGRIAPLLSGGRLTWRSE